MNLSMPTKVISSIIIVLVSILLSAEVAWAEPVPSDSIAVDRDAYYKSLNGNAAYSEITRNTQDASGILADAVKTSKEKAESSFSVGEVQLLYADGWREFTLRAIGNNAEIWVANDLSYCSEDTRPPDEVTQEQIDYLFDEFNNVIYPHVTYYFGYTKNRNGTNGYFTSEGYNWYVTDNPQRVMILVYNIIDEQWCDPDFPFYVAGYFWPAINEIYADRNIIHIDSRDWSHRIGHDAAIPHLYEQVFAHEYEHAIHFDHDADEPSWVDEGMANLASYLSGYGHSRRHLEYYMTYHRTPLTFWGGGLEDYGESYLFQLYLLENFGGPEFIKALVNEGENGIAGIEKQLDIFGYDTSFEDIYRDWTLANYLDDPSLTGKSGAKLGYENLDIPSIDTNGVSIQWSIENVYGSDNAGNLPIPRYWGGFKSGTVQWPAGSLPSYTPMYLNYKGYQPELKSTFMGDNSTGITAFSGNYELWGGRADLLFNTATIADTFIPGPNAKLSFMTLYDIENLWDFGFIQISTDGGISWASLENSDTTLDHDSQAHPDVVNNLPGFTGNSGGWIEETFDLSGYEGTQVLLRFLYITDWAQNGNGFYIDDIRIVDDNSELLWDDLESGSGKWTLNGWEYTTGQIENDWELTFINPIYNLGKFSQNEIRDDNIYVSDNYQKDITSLNTQKLNRDKVTIVLSNHLPENGQFSSKYILLVNKGDARK
jgi:immune inhibitor A